MLNRVRKLRLLSNMDLSRFRILPNLEDVCLIFATACFFVVMQGLFWWFFGSTQLEAVIKDKALLMEYFIRLSDPEVKSYVCHHMKKNLDAYVAPISEEERRSQNLSLLTDSLTPWIRNYGIATIVFGALAFRRINGLNDSMVKKKTRKDAFYFGLIFVLLSFSTEIYVFFGVIKPTILMGDIEIFNIIRESQSELYKTKVSSIN